MWVDANWWDVLSDLHVFHSVDDPVELDPHTLINYAHRLVAYKGMVRARSELDARDATAATEVIGDDPVDWSGAQLAADPLFGQVIEYG